MSNGAVGARQVGEFPNMDRKVVRSRKNPIDKCTIVSIFPKAIKEVKPAVEPGIFDIPAGTFDIPGISIVGGSSWWKDINEDQPLLEIPVSSPQVAEAVINDYCRGLLAYRPGTQQPGLFFVLGPKTVADVKREFAIMLKEAKQKQDAWFLELIRIADSLWARSNGNPLAIHNDMRLAAEQLSISDKPWMQDFKAMQMVNCKYCGALKNPEYPVCGSCRAVDMTHPLAKEIKFAQ